MKPYILRSLRIVACGLVLFLSACGKDDDNTVQPPATPQEETLAGNKEKPDWQIPSEQDLTASMTAVVRVNLSLTYPTQMAALSGSSADGQIPGAGDLLAAFSGETCLGVAQNTDGLFYLYIARPPKGADQAIDLRFYSATLKNVFLVGKVFTFVADASQGSVSAPLEPSFLKTD